MGGKIGIFLGSGASNLLDYPVTETFMNQFKNEDKIKEMIPDVYRKLSYLSYIEYVATSFLTDDAFHFKDQENPNNNKDLEHLLHTIYKLRNLQKEFSTTFLFDKSISIGIKLSLAEFISTHIPKIQHLVHKAVFDTYRWNENKKDSLSFYASLIDMAHSKNEGIVSIFTTNYDSIIEQFCSSYEIPFVDGFVGNYYRFEWKGNFDSLVNDNKKAVLLIKLHGSLTWQKKDGIIFRSMDNEEYTPDESKIVIYPTLDPKNFETGEPYDALFKRYSDELGNNINILIVIGFSFRDSKIVASIKNFLRNEKNLMIVISPTGKQDFERTLLPQEEYVNYRIIEQKVKPNTTTDIIKQISDLIQE